MSEADASLAEAADLFRRSRLSHDLAQTELTRAECALLAGRPEEAVRWARSGRRRFARRNNAAWLARAELVLCRAELAAALAAREREAPGGPGTGARDVARAARRARGLAVARAADAGRQDVGRAAWVTAAEGFAAAADLDSGPRGPPSAGRMTRREPLSLTIQVRLVRRRSPSSRGTGTCPAARPRRPARARGAPPAPGLGGRGRAAAVHGHRLAEEDVGAALRAGTPWPCSTPSSAGARPSPGTRACDRPGPGARRPARRAAPVPRAGAPPRARRCDARRAGDAPAGCRAAPGGSAGALVAGWATASTPRRPPASTRSASPATRGDGATVADYVVHGGVVHAVVLDASGVRLRALGDVREIEEVAHRLRAGLRALANPVLPAPIRDVVARSLRRGLQVLDDRLVTPVGCEGDLHVVAGGASVTLPWGLVPSRAGRATSVSSRIETAAPAAPTSSAVVALAGPGLAHAVAEVDAVARSWPDADALTGPAATSSAAAAALAGADVVHLAAHGHHEVESPLFSWVRLADGPLFAHELEGVRVPGSLVVLAACEVGRATVRPGGEVLGLASVLLRLGAGAVVAPLAPLRDEVAAQVMPTFHDGVRQGLDPASALAAACSAWAGRSRSRASDRSPDAGAGRSPSAPRSAAQAPAARTAAGEEPLSRTSRPQPAAGTSRPGAARSARTLHCGRTPSSS